jgi:2-polyprenyl-6-hydroxyphenyl methylase/3-demethylubiquinone-9 3-methyltransferase
MSHYYSESLSGKRLKLCYDLAPPRVQQYLDEEKKCICERIKPGDYVLELGCGYGRVLKELAFKTDYIFGIDNSWHSLHFGQETYLSSDAGVLICMDAKILGYHENQFDIVFCIQNGISALNVDPALLIQEAIRVTKPSGKVLFSSYSDKFWNDRMDWFKIQSEHGLIGEIDHELTGEGVIICKDGFKATTFSTAQFESLISIMKREYRIFEVDESSIFCEIIA